MSISRNYNKAPPTNQSFFFCPKKKPFAYNLNLYPHNIPAFTKKKGPKSLNPDTCL